MGAAPTRVARRLTPEARRDQLAGVALELTAESGYAGLGLEEIAERAGVTRAALYRYFPRGKLDAFLAAAERAGEILTADLVTDEAVPLAERQRRNFATFVEHALQPSDAWLAYRRGRGSGLAEADAIHERYRERLIETMAVNHFGSADPSPLAKATLRGFLSFAETAIDECRARGVGREETLSLLAGTLTAAVAEAKRIEER